MKKIIIWGIVLSLALTPSYVWASPGPIDQYGGHVCSADCSLYGLKDGEYHYHDIPGSPSYLLGNLAKTSPLKFFYEPILSPDKKTVKFTSADNPGLQKNSSLDTKICQTSDVFAYGLYDNQGKARVKPVCAADTVKILGAKNLVSGNLIYAAIPDTDSQEINRVYHISLGSRQYVYTDRPDLSELKGKLIRGFTDKMLYFVYPYDSELTIRPISEQLAILYRGANYQDQILYFDDSIIYTYKIGQPLM